MPGGVCNNGNFSRVPCVRATTIVQPYGKLCLPHIGRDTKFRRQSFSTIIVLCNFLRTNCVMVLRWTLQLQQRNNALTCLHFLARK